VVILAHPHAELYASEAQACVAYAGSGPKTVVVDQSGSCICRIHSLSSSEVVGSGISLVVMAVTVVGHGVVKVDVVRRMTVSVVLHWTVSG
jgi:hypothetical protein